MVKFFNKEEKIAERKYRSAELVMQDRYKSELKVYMVSKEAKATIPANQSIFVNVDKCHKNDKIHKCLVEAIKMKIL